MTRIAIGVQLITTDWEDAEILEYLDAHIRKHVLALLTKDVENASTIPTVRGALEVNNAKQSMLRVPLLLIT